MTLPNLQKEARELLNKELSGWFSNELTHAFTLKKINPVLDLLVSQAYQAGKDAAVEYIKQYSPATRSKRIYSVHIDTLEKARQAL